VITQVFKVKNMHCSGCSLVLESIEDELKGIQSISASYRKQQLEVKYDEHLLREEEILNAIRQKGYEGECISTLKTST